MNHSKEQQQRFDLIVLGGGPGGYPAAIRAAQKGKSVALVEAKELGGTCLNRGCIPSKALIAQAELYMRIQEGKELGISVQNLSFDYAKMAAHKNQVVHHILHSLTGLIAANKITVFQGFGKLTSATTIKVQGKDNALLTADQIIIATGSEPKYLPNIPCDHRQILDSTSLLDLKKLPKRLLIVGGGVIGSEFASLYAALGVEIVIIEMMSRIIPMESEVVSQTLMRAFQKRGIQIETGVKVEKAETSSSGVSLHLSNGKRIDGEIALVAVGRSLNTKGIGLESAGVFVQENGLIPVNSKMETNIPGIYAVGDIASTWWLAHVASHQGIVAAENAMGGSAEMHYNAVPSVIFTSPEIGTVGLSLEQAQAKGYSPIVGAFPFQVLGKSQAALQTDGFAQVIVDSKTGQVLGAQVVGHEASSLIAQMALAISNELTIESITETIHAHPTISEAWLEAAFMAEGMPLHLPPKSRKAKESVSA